MTHMRLEEIGRTKSGRTSIFHIKNLDSISLGSISWYGAWRKYTFHPLAGTLYDSVCLRELSDLLESLTKQQKEITRARK